MFSIVPDGWRVEKLGNIIHRAHQGINTAADKVEFDFQGYPIIQTRNITGGVLHFENIKYVNKNDWDLYKEKYQPKINDILLSNIGTIGKNILINKNEDFLIHWNIFLIEPIINLISPTFLKKYFDKLDNENYYERFLKGGTVKFISKGFLTDLLIPIPPLPQQEKIVKVLDISSLLIEKQKELIESYDLFLKSKFIEMFGDPIQNPIGWEVVKIEDISSEIRYGTNEKSDKKIENSIPVLRIPNIGDRSLKYNDMKYSILSKKEYETLRLQKGDLLFIRTNGNPKYIGKCISFEEDFDCVYASYIIRVKLKNQKILSRFIEFILSMPTYRQLVLKEAKTTAGNYNINTQSIKKFKLINPPTELQNKFASIVEKTETIKAKETKKLEKLQTLHKSLMDKAFKGEIE